MKTTTNADLLLHINVIRAITGALRKFGVRREDLEDGVMEAQTRTLEYLRDKPQPTTVEEWAATCVTVTKHWRMDENEKRKTEKKYCAGLCEDPDEHVGLERAVQWREDLDAKRMIEVLRQQFDAGVMPDKGDEILSCIQAGMNYQKTAVELGISAEAVRKRLQRMQELFTARLAALGMTVTVVVLTLGFAGSAMAAANAEPSAPSPAVPVPPPRSPPGRIAA